MAGLAFYSSATFTENLGVSPHPVQDIPVTKIEILGPDSVYGMSGEYTVSYTPASATKKGVIWTVAKGGTYASIGQSGLLSVSESANDSEVVIRATSKYDGSVSAEITVRVTYYGGGISDTVQSFCERVVSDGGTLLHGTATATQGVYNRHKSLLGVDPKLDFLGYKTGVDGNVSKLYSIDSRYDCTGLANIILQDGVFTTVSSEGYMKWMQNLVLSGTTDMTHLYYEGPTEQSNFQDSIFIANLLASSHPVASEKRTAIFHQGGLVNVQYAYKSKDFVNGYPGGAFTRLLVTVDPAADAAGYQYVTAISVDGVDVTGQKTAAADYWGGDIGSVSYIKIYPGFILCIAG